jgi:3'-5' exoribonuclease
MSRKFVTELVDGENVEEIFLLSEKQLRANRNASLYLLATLRDKSGTINGLMWNVSDESMSQMNAGDFIKAKGKVQLYQGGLQMILTSIKPVSSDDLDPNDFHPQSALNVDQLLARVKELLLSIEDVHLKSLMECFFIDETIMTNFCLSPAGIKTHHAYQGGLLEHVTSLLEIADRITPLYPDLNIDLLKVGIFLHDLGKTRELSFESSFAYTDEGQLLGHMHIANEMLEQKIQETESLLGEPFPAETALRLKHMVLSHHGSYEFGSSKLPMTPEAIALHHLDNLDAKLNEFSRSIADDPNAQSSWTPFSPRLDRKLFKGLKSGQ